MAIGDPYNPKLHLPLGTRVRSKPPGKGGNPGYTFDGVGEVFDTRTEQHHIGVRLPNGSEYYYMKNHLIIVNETWKKDYENLA